MSALSQISPSLAMVDSQFGISPRRRTQMFLAGVRKRSVHALGRGVSAIHRSQPPSPYRPGTTVVVVNWNSLAYLRRTLAAVRAMSPMGTEILVVDNASRDGSRRFLRDNGIPTLFLPFNFGHGIALDLAVPGIRTEYVAVLDVDAFPISNQWLQKSLAALDDGAKVAGARLHRNFVHPSFFVARASTLHQYRLTFRPLGPLRRTPNSAPLILDVGEALSQRLITKFGGGPALHMFEATSVRGPGQAGSVFGELVYHNLYATQGKGNSGALSMFEEEFMRYHRDLPF